jgi:RNA polymerase sigma-70 factor (ECF subfamily)
MTEPDSELLLRLRAGDVGACEELVDRFERKLIRYFFGLSGDTQLAEDCAQEVFVRLYRARETWTPDAALSTFVFRIARNLWIDVYRSRKVRPQSASLDAPTGDAEDGARSSLAERMESDVATPDAYVVANEDQERLRAAIARLPEGQRAVLDLAGGQGLKYEQVAEILGIPVGTVKSRVHAAVQNLRRLLIGPPGDGS